MISTRNKTSAGVILVVGAIFTIWMMRERLFVLLLGIFFNLSGQKKPPAHWPLQKQVQYILTQEPGAVESSPDGIRADYMKDLGRDAFPLVIKAFARGSGNGTEVRGRAIYVAGYLGIMDAAEPILAIFKDHSEPIEIRSLAATSLGDLRYEAALQPLADSWGNAAEPENVRHSAIFALSRYQLPEGLMIQILTKVRSRAIDTNSKVDFFGAFGEKPQLRDVAMELIGSHSESPELLCYAAGYLGSHRVKAAMPRLIALLPIPPVRDPHYGTIIADPAGEASKALEEMTRIPLAIDGFEPPFLRSWKIAQWKRMWENSHRSMDQLNENSIHGLVPPELPRSAMPSEKARLEARRLLEAPDDTIGDDELRAKERVYKLSTLGDVVIPILSETVSRETGKGSLERIRAIYGLGILWRREAGELLVRLLRDSHEEPKARAWAALSLGRMHYEPAKQYLVAISRDGSAPEELRRYATYVLKVRL